MPPKPMLGAVAMQKITFSAIQGARLDKLIADMLSAYDKELTAAPGMVIETGLGPEIESKSLLSE